MSVCTGCMACERACPIAVIKISTDKDPANPKQRVITQFDIDEVEVHVLRPVRRALPDRRHPAHARVRRHHEVRRQPGFRWVPDPEQPVPFYRPVKGQDAPRAPVGEILKQAPGRGFVGRAAGPASGGQGKDKG